MTMRHHVRLWLTCFCLGVLAAVLPGLPAHADDAVAPLDTAELIDLGATLDDLPSDATLLLDSDSTSELGTAPDQDRRCAADCQRRARAAYETCVANGGAEARCEAHSKQLYESCLREHCAPSDVAPPACDTACAERARRAHATCLEEGGSERECRAKAEQVREECLQRCDPQPSSCRQKCAEQAERVYQECLRTSDSERTCAERKRQAFERCLAAECPSLTPGRPQPDPGPVRPDPAKCETRCAEAARDYLRQCIEEHGDEAACTNRAKTRYEECVARCNPSTAPGPNRCEAGCRERAAREMESCLANGRDPVACRVRIQQMLDKCLGECTPDSSVRPAPTACETRCEAYGRQVYKACIAGSIGAVANDCEREAANAVRECIQDNCRPKVDECALECRELGAAAYRRCLSGEDADRETCAALARSVVEKCMTGCRPNSGGGIGGR